MVPSFSSCTCTCTRTYTRICTSTRACSHTCACARFHHPLATPRRAPAPTPLTHIRSKLSNPVVLGVTPTSRVGTPSRSSPNPCHDIYSHHPNTLACPLFPSLKALQ